MNDSLQRRALDLFERLVELPAEARETALAAECAGDASLEREVRALLAAESTAPEFFEGLSERFGLNALRGQEDTSPLPREIGPYHIVELVGRGGMGAVYLAERAGADFEQRVAIKVLPMPLAGPEARRRFKAERQILARLNHPNIAALYDGGITEDSTLYFVMEYVDGRPINEACDASAMTVEGRIGRFLQVCEAVSYAHRNLVVHRDLKPANILVDTAGRVRLLDFGIAKVLDENADDAQLTRAGHRRMTPRYASPELVRGEMPTTASDVYSLGVLLHELLTGRSPYRGGPTTEVEFARAIEEQEPLLASRRLEQAEGDEESVEVLAQRRGVPSSALVQRLRGDLDAIVARAIEKDPERRYASVEELVDDLRRHLRDEPIRARTPGVADRARKFVRRHRTGVLAAATSALALIALVVISVVYAVDSRRQSERVAAERERAEEIRDFLLGIFEVSDPNESKGESITARELLDRGAERVREDLDTRPRTRATLMETIASVYDRLSLYDRADSQYAEAMSLLESEGLQEADEYAQIVLGRAAMIERKGRYREALPYAERAMEHYRRGESAAGLVQTNVIVGRLHHRLGEFDEAERYYREALEWTDALGTEDRLFATEAYSAMGTLSAEREDYAGAEEYHRKALQIRSEVLGDDLSLIECYYNLGLAARFQDRYDEAKRYYEEALALTARLVPDGHADDAFMLAGLAFVHREKGELELAAQRFSESVEVSRRFVGERHPFVGINLGNLGSVRLDQGKMAEAEQLLDQSLDILVETIPDHPIVGRVRADLADLYDATGRGAEAANLREASAADGG